MSYQPEQQSQMAEQTPYQPGQPPFPPQQQLQASPKKRGIFRKKRTWFAIIAVVIFLVIVVNISKGSNASITTSPSTGSSQSSVGSNPSTSSGPAKVGDTITLDDVACTLTSVKVLQNDGIDTPKAGNEFIVVHVKIVNHGSSEQSYNPLDFHAKSGSGNISDVEFSSPQTYTANNILNSGTLAANGTIEGDLILQVPVGDHKAQFTWQPSFFGNAGDNAWLLGL